MAEIDFNKEMSKIEQAKEQHSDNSLTISVKNEIQTRYDENVKELAKNEDIANLTKEMAERRAKVILTKEMLDILTEEQRLELSAYMLQCEKEQLDFKKKKEKKVIIEEVKAEVVKRKIDVLKKRYGYMYKKDANGNLIDFVPSKSVNRQREIANWWNGQSDNFKRFVKGALKFLFWGAIAFVGYKLFIWIAQNFNNIPKI